jgi:hypothetical protein
MTKYKLKRTDRVFHSYYYRRREYWYEVYERVLGILWIRQFHLEGYFINDKDAKLSVEKAVIERREAREEAKKHKNIRLEI